MRRIVLVISVFITLLSSVTYSQSFELVIPSGHTDLVNIIRFNETGSHLVTATRDPVILKLWEYKSGKELRTLKGPKRTITEILYYKDTIIAGDASGNIFVWNAFDGELIKSFQVHVFPIKKLFKDKENTLWCVTSDGNIYAWKENWESYYTAQFNFSIADVAINDRDNVLYLAASIFPAVLSFRLNNFEKEEIILPEEIDFSVESMMYNTTREQLFLGGRNKIGIYQLPSNQIEILEVDGTPLAIDIYQNRLAIGFRERRCEIIDVQSTKSWSISNYQFPVTDVKFSIEDGNLVTTSEGVNHGNMRIRYFDIDKQMEVKHFVTLTDKISDSFYDTFQETLLMSSYSTDIHRFNLRNNAYSDLKGHTKWVQNLLSSSGSPFVISQSRDFREVFLWEDNRVVSDEIADSLNLCYSNSSLWGWSKKSGVQYSLSMSDDETLAIAKLGNDSSAIPVDTIYTGNGKQLTSLRKGSFCSIDGEFLSEKFPSKFVRNDQHLFALLHNRDSITVFNEAGVVIRQLRDTDIRDFAIHSDSILVLSRGNGSVRIIDFNNNRDSQIDLPTSEVSSINFMYPLPFILASSIDGFVAVIEPTTGTHLLLLPMPDLGFVVYDPATFLFDGTDAAIQNIYITLGYEFINIAQLKDRYFEPDLLRKFLGFSSGQIRKPIELKLNELYPTIWFDDSDPESITVRAKNRGGGIGRISVHLNSMEVYSDIRPQNFNSMDDEIKIRVKRNNFRNLKNGENLLEIRAWNQGNWLVSPALPRILKPKQTKGAQAEVGSTNSQKPNPAVHILACGVSNYQGDDIDLRYSSKDATDMAFALEVGARKLFGVEKSFVYLLNDSGILPTKENIISTIKNIASKASPYDIFIVYLSGHGINWGGENGDFYYLTQEAYSTSLDSYNDSGIREKVTLSSKELIELFKIVPSDKRILIIDACASGKLVDNLMESKDISSSTLRALDRMRDRTGFHIITGCAADAVSYEASRFGQGVLTYSLIEGIKGASLRENKFVDINQLFQYARERVPVLAKGVGGIQSPQVFSPSGAQSFDIGELDDAAKGLIPLPKTRPVYVRSQFIDQDNLSDVLTLSKKLDEALNETSAKGENAPLLFVDVGDYPEGCKLSGLYQQTPTGITLSMKKVCGGEEVKISLKGKSTEELIVKILESLK